MSNTLHGTPIQPKPPSPPSPSFQDKDKQSSAQRSFIDLTNSTPIRGQTAPFPLTPTSFPYPAPLEPPPGMLFVDFIQGWSDPDVAKWLAEIKCAHNADIFKANDIRGDILLELDQGTLKEMGVASIGDRLRIVNAVKILRQKAASKVPTTPVVETNSVSQPSSGFPESSTTTRQATRKLESGRPAPLQLPPTAGRQDLPRLVREQSMPDSAKSAHGRHFAPTTPSATPVTSHIPRPGLPQLPSAPRNQPPIPAPSNRGASRLNGRRTPTPTPTDPPALTSQPLPPAPSQANLQPPINSGRPTFHLPSDPRPGSAGSKPPPRTPSPNHNVPPRSASRQANNLHNRTHSGSNLKTSPSHPYATASSTLRPPPQQINDLSPIAESFGPAASQSGPPSPPVLSSASGVGRNTPNTIPMNPSLDDLRKYIVKFVLPEEGHSWKISIQDCAGGVEILEKVLKKLDKGSTRSPDNDSHERVLLDGGGLSVDGWSVYMDRDGHGPPLTEAELLSICHSPDHSAREQGLTLRKTARTRPYGARNYLEPGARNTKRASSISILSELGVRDPERALEPPSPTGSTMTGTTSSQHASKKPSKLRNFFGQRPPSELITTHLTEYFPYTEKKVLERTARNSMMRTTSQSGGRRDSTVSSIAHLPSRFSVSTQGSVGHMSMSPPRASMSSNISNTPSMTDTDNHSAFTSHDEIPRVSLSTDDGRRFDLAAPSPHLLPPIPFPTESLSQSLHDFAAGKNRRTPSISSRRTSYMKELRSKKDRSDTASLMTVDQITAEVESRRESLAIDRMAIDSNSNSEIDEWTKVDEDEDLAGSTLHDDAEVELEMAVAPEDASAEDEEEDEEDELEDEDEDQSLDDEDEVGKATTSGGRKWIKGALIGSGSFGQVYLGMDASTGLLMAVKQVELPTGSAPNEERKKQMLSALEREIELLKDLQHDNIVQYLYSSLDDDHLNIFLEYVPGGSVTALLRNYGAFEEPLVKNFVRQISYGLHYLHERDIIHRDIKGANILVDNKGGIKISDFGISKKVETNLLMNKRVSLQGSVFWMAPEVIKQTEHTNKADIWSVGCLVVEMLTGEHPFAQLSQMQAIFKIGSSARPDIPSDISSEAQDFLAKTFDFKQENRPSAAELLQHPWIAVKQSKAKPSDATG